MEMQILYLGIYFTSEYREINFNAVKKLWKLFLTFTKTFSIQVSLIINLQKILCVLFHFVSQTCFLI